MPSLAAMLEAWLQLCELGAWYYDVEDNNWDERYELFPDKFKGNPALR